MRHAANKPVLPAPGIFSPLRHAVFRRIWTASLLSNLGLLVLGEPTQPALQGGLALRCDLPLPFRPHNAPAQHGERNNGERQGLGV